MSKTVYRMILRLTAPDEFAERDRHAADDED